MSLPDLTGLGQSDLDALLSALRDEASEITTQLSDASTADDADLDRLAAIADEVDSVNEALAAVETRLAERADKAAKLSARITPVVELPIEEVVPVSEPVVAAVVEPVVASLPVVAHPAPRKVVANAPKAPLNLNSDTRKVAIVAAAGVAGLRAGQEVTLLDMVKPAISNWSSYGNQAYAKNELFSVKAPARDPRLVANGHNDQDVMEYAGSTARLTHTPAGQSGIVAAGGWCAPAEQRFDICTLAELDGIWDVPTVAMPRGSISYFRQLDYSVVAAAIAAGEFTFTNAQLVTLPAVVKPCFEIPCATPVTGTLDVVGLCLRAGLLQNKAFPELIAAWMDVALIAFAHYRNARNLAQAVALAGSALVSPANTATIGAITPLIDWVSMQAINMRLDQGMAADAELELVLPFWVPAVIDADHIKRQFNSENPFDLSGALARLNVRVQYVKDLQDSVFSGAGAVTAWPTSITALLYPAGAFMRGTEDVITVSTLVDSTLLQTNRMQLLFFEAADTIMPWCGNAALLTINVCPSGQTSGPVVFAAQSGALGSIACGD